VAMAMAMAMAMATGNAQRRRRRASASEREETKETLKNTVNAAGAVLCRLVIPQDRA
jgi:hypothetical protein